MVECEDGSRIPEGLVPRRNYNFLLDLDSLGVL